MARIFREIPNGIPVIVFHVTDHDPSGDHMPEDLQRRLSEFYQQNNVEVRKVCLTREQVVRFNLPGKPVNKDDNRKTRFAEKYGNAEEVVELNALPIPDFQRIVEDAIRKELDMDIFEDVVKKEREEREEIRKGIEAALKNRTSPEKRSD